MKTDFRYPFLLLLIVPLFHLPTVAAQSRHRIDSLSYETQRQKVNRLLDERKIRFGEYDLSLQKKSGVFGMFKNKRDMQRSIDILKEIVLTDNNIFVETKKLVDLKDYQKDYYEQLATEYDEQALAYRKTITKLQLENDRLRDNIAQLSNKEHGNNIWLYLSLLVTIGLLISTLVAWYKRHKVKKLTKL